MIIATRLDQIYYSKMSYAALDTFAQKLALWFESQPTDRKGRLVTHYTIEFDGYYLLTFPSRNGVATYVKAAFFAERMKEYAPDIKAVPRSRIDITNKLDYLDLKYILAIEPSMFLAGARSVGYSGGVFYDFRERKPGGHVIRFQHKQSLIPIPYASQKNKFKDRYGQTVVKASAVLMRQTESWSPILEFLCDFADLIGSSIVSIDQKWHDSDPETLEGCWGPNHGLRPCPIHFAIPPGTNINLYNEIIVPYAFNRDKMLMVQRYAPTKKYATPETLSHTVNYGIGGVERIRP